LTSPSLVAQQRIRGGGLVDGGDVGEQALEARLYRLNHLAQVGITTEGFDAGEERGDCLPAGIRRLGLRA
jgi:hypothetical protein